jgi:hypothetical protein
MKKPRRLSDLYVRGMEVEVDDGQGPPVKVWLAKVNAVDRDSMIRRANAAKARYLIETDNEESDLFAEQYAQVREYEDRDGLVALAISEDLRRFRERTEAEVAADEDTWGKDDYLQGLVDSWFGTDDQPGFAAVIAEDPNDPEALRVKAEIDRFGDQVQKLVDAEIERLKAEWEDVPDEQLWRTVAHQILEQKATNAFVEEAMRQQLFYAVRELDRTTRYFSTVAEVDELDEAVRGQLMERLNTLSVETTEGKDSPGDPDSSPSSEVSASPEEPKPSGPEVVSV